MEERKLLYKGKKGEGMIWCHMQILGQDAIEQKNIAKGWTEESDGPRVI